MYLFELDQSNSMDSQIVVLVDQLKQGLHDHEVDPNNYTVNDLLAYFKKYDVILDKEDLYKMIQVPPLKSLIKNIKGNKVIFKGYTDTPDYSDITHKTAANNKKTVAKMAKKALK